MEKVLEWKTGAVMLTLALFGIAYNQFVAWLEEKGYGDGYTAILVVGGSAATIAAAIPLIGLKDSALITLCFISSGLPMIAGSITRHVRERQDEANVVKEMIAHYQDQNDDAHPVRYIAGHHGIIALDQDDNDTP